MRCAFMAKSAIRNASPKRSTTERHAGIFFCGARTKVCFSSTSSSEISGVLA